MFNNGLTQKDKKDLSSLNEEGLERIAEISSENYRIDYKGLLEQKKDLELKMVKKIRSRDNWNIVAIITQLMGLLLGILAEFLKKDICQYRNN